MLNPTQHATPHLAASVYPIPQPSSNRLEPMSTVGMIQLVDMQDASGAARPIPQEYDASTVDELGKNPAD